MQALAEAIIHNFHLGGPLKKILIMQNEQLNFSRDTVAYLKKKIVWNNGCPSSQVFAKCYITMLSTLTIFVERCHASTLSRVATFSIQWWHVANLKILFSSLWLLVASWFSEEPKIDWRSKQAKYFGHLSDGGQSVVGVRKWSKQRLRGAGTPSGQEEHLHPLYTPLPPLIPYLWSSDILEHTKHNNTSVCLPNYPTTEPHIYPSQSQQYICNQV